MVCIYCECTETVPGQWYGCVGDVVEVDEVQTEILERKEVVRRDGEDLAYAKPEGISELLLYPEFTDDQYNQTSL